MAPLLARTAVRGALAADALGWNGKVASLMTLVYGIEYYRGVRKETGSLGDAIRAYRAYRHRAEAPRTHLPREDRELAADDDRPSGPRVRGPEARAAFMGIARDKLPWDTLP
jgi:hypothetical protein